MLRTIASTVWNFEERRVRAGFRFVVQMAIRVVLLIALSRIVGAVAAWRGDLPGSPGWHWILKRWSPAGIPYRVALALVEPIAAVAAALLACRYLDRRELRSLGFRFSTRWWVDYAAGLAIGVAAIGFIFAAGLAIGAIAIDGTCVGLRDGSAFGVLFAIGVLANCGNGLEEELGDRAYLLRNAAEGFRTRRIGTRVAVWLAWLLTSVIFGIAHLGTLATPTAIFDLMVVGAFFGLPYVVTGELGISIGIHTTWNLAQSMIFGLATRGQPGESLITVHQNPGARLWMGTPAFGPEGGLLSLGACGVGAALVCAWVRMTRGAIETKTSRFEWTPRTERSVD